MYGKGASYLTDGYDLPVIDISDFFEKTIAFNFIVIVSGVLTQLYMFVWW